MENRTRLPKRGGGGSLSFIISGFAGFTLTEVLLAVAIVGIIAALVLPMVVKNYQEKTLDAALKREKQTLESSIASLLINENTDDYKKTMLYTNESAPSSYATTSGAYITKYLKVSKYCGDNSGACFADKYYEYKDGDKKEYTPTYKGACASLKNGSSICIEPQTPSHGVRILLDINGKKSPNVKGRDLHEYEIALPAKGSLDRTSNAVNWDYKLVDIKPPCAEGETSEECCESNFNVGCCTEFPEKYGSLDACKACTATKGNPADCCTTSSEYANAHKSTCCTTITEYFDSNKSACCTLNPSDSKCQEDPPKPDKTVIMVIMYKCDVWFPYKDKYGNHIGFTQCLVNVKNPPKNETVHVKSNFDNITCNGSTCSPLTYPYDDLHYGGVLSGLTSIKPGKNSYSCEYSFHGTKYTPSGFVPSNTSVLTAKYEYTTTNSGEFISYTDRVSCEYNENARSASNLAPQESYSGFLRGGYGNP